MTCLEIRSLTIVQHIQANENFRGQRKLEEEWLNFARCRTL